MRAGASNKGCGHTVSPQPGLIVGYGFRCWLTSLRADEALPCRQACAEWQQSIAAMPCAQELPAAFLSWALAVEVSAARPVTLAPLESSGFAADEHLAILTVAAAQGPACPALDACVSALLSGGDTGRTMEAAVRIAGLLEACGQRVVPLTPRSLH